MHKPQIIALLETHVSGPAADEICRKIGYQGIFREEAYGHRGGTWLLWEKERIYLNLIDSHTQYATMAINQQGTRPWMFT